MRTDRADRASRNVLAASAGVSGVITVGLLLWRPTVALGYAGGVVTGAGMLGVLVFILTRATVPSEERTAPIWLLLVVQTMKLLVAAAVAFVVILVWDGSAAGFAAGYTTAVIVLVVMRVYGPASSAADRSHSDEDASDAE
ncbi:MAG: hypothetical protein ACQER1_07685 [Armatimonadota bacterium]